MSPSLAREYFQYSAGDGEVALVAGRFQPSPEAPAPGGGTLEDLCDWLDLSRLVVLDVQRLVDCRMPPRPSGIAGLLLDAVPRGELAHWRTTLESLWGVPVIGSLPMLGTPGDFLYSWDSARSMRGNGEMATAFAWSLSEELGKHLRFEQLLKLLEGRDLPAVSTTFYQPSEKLGGLTVAVAYDEVFHGYFPGVFDAFELHGATVVDFSPLHDEVLPVGTDIVYLGGGDPITYATQLAANHCLIAALRSHVCQGGRVYAEGGGLAYLCQSVRLPLPSSQTGAGQHLPMAGIFPAVAVYRRKAEIPQPVEVTLSSDHWLGPAGTLLRGYRDSAWRIEPFDQLASYTDNPSRASNLSRELDLMGRHRAIGSRLQINFAAQRDFLQRFLPLEVKSVRAATP